MLSSNYLLSISPVVAPMTTLNALAIPEQMFILVQDHVKGSFDSKTCTRTHPRSHCYSVEDRENVLADMDSIEDSHVLRGNALADIDMIEDYVALACDLFSRRLFHEAGATLDHASAAMKQMILAQDPHAIVRILSMLRNCLFEGRYELGLIILRYFSHMGAIILGRTHPFPRICHWITSQDQSRMPQALETLSCVIADIFASILGRLHRSTLRVSTDTASIIGYSSKAQACTRLKMLLEECQSKLGSHDYRTVEARRMLMDLQFVTGDKAEAECHAWAILASADEIQDARVSKWYRVFGLRTVAHCHFAIGQIDSAITKLNQALELHDRHDSWSRRWLLNLERWHSQQGDEDAAMQVRNKRLAMFETQLAV